MKLIISVEVNKSYILKNVKKRKRKKSTESLKITRFSRVHPFHRQTNHRLEGNRSKEPIKKHLLLQTNMAAYQTDLNHTEGVSMPSCVVNFYSIL